MVPTERRRQTYWEKLKRRHGFWYKLSQRLGWENKKPFFTLEVVLVIVVALLFFILGIQTIRAGARGSSQYIASAFHGKSALNTLGIGWLFSYLMLSGSPVAAAALSFFESGVINLHQTYTMLVGTRFGAIFVTLFFGLIYYLQGTHSQRSLAVGVIGYLTTFTMAFGSLLVGLPLLSWTNFRFALPSHFSAGIGTFTDPLVQPLSELLHPLAVFMLGLGLLVVSFKLLDKGLPDPRKRGFDHDRLQRFLHSPYTMFALGLGVTFLTPSVTVSCGILVPFYVKGYIRSSRLVPYIMGANISTFSDTLMAALVMKNPAGVHAVIVEVVSISVVSLTVLIFFFKPYEAFIERWTEYFIQNVFRLMVFLAMIFVVPILLVIY